MSPVVQSVPRTAPTRVVAVPLLWESRVLVPSPRSAVTCYESFSILEPSFLVCKIKVPMISPFSTALVIHAAPVLTVTSGPWRAAHVYFWWNNTSKAGGLCDFPPGLSWTCSHIPSSKMQLCATTLLPFLLIRASVLARDQTCRFSSSQGQEGLRGQQGS